ncbi:exported hypothetical protein [Desulfamplus magnetovallimortis]|uniref:Uncharacterized protein n=1 Tax=Desulfamplus magnetovallimortis TaxID=1246637 RepID=A0A1W1HBR9_9BACT|nr:hypothetical protein [Desulfamplus magnetovallimortis]SLM29937.1 exported hypothetical protein [Desulfamplus magnetovallimortis]
MFKKAILVTLLLSFIVPFFLYGAVRLDKEFLMYLPYLIEKYGKAVVLESIIGKYTMNYTIVYDGKFAFADRGLHEMPMKFINKYSIAYDMDRYGFTISKLIKELEPTKSGQNKTIQQLKTYIVIQKKIKEAERLLEPILSIYSIKRALNAIIKDNNNGITIYSKKNLDFYTVDKNLQEINDDYLNALSISYDMKKNNVSIEELAKRLEQEDIEAQKEKERLRKEKERKEKIRQAELEKKRIKKQNLKNIFEK